MEIEIEKKYRLKAGDASRLSIRANELGAEFVARDFEENIVFSNDVLRSRESIARLRRIGDRTILTFKRREIAGGEAKTHVEHETEVADFDAAASILQELGLKPVLIYEKRRETWSLGEVLLMIDELPFGHYAEIEGDPEQISVAEKMLGADECEVEESTYPQLTARLGRKSHELVEARFADG